MGSPLGHGTLVPFASPMTDRKFRFGIAGRAQTRAGWQDFARQAEDLGFSTLVIPDHFSAQLAPLPAIISAAAVTSRLRFGTNVLDNDFRHPAVLAKEAATVDLLTDGRFELGLGAGWSPSDYSQTGIPFDGGAVRLAPQRQVPVKGQPLQGLLLMQHGDGSGFFRGGNGVGVGVIGL